MDDNLDSSIENKIKLFKLKSINIFKFQIILLLKIKIFNHKKMI